MSKGTDPESELIKKLSSCFSSHFSKRDHPTNHADDDLHFLVLLYDHFKAMDSQLKEQVQSEILGMLQKHNYPHPPVHKESFGCRHNKSRQEPGPLSTQNPIQVEPPLQYQAPQPEFSVYNEESVGGCHNYQYSLGSNISIESRQEPMPLHTQNAIQVGPPSGYQVPQQELPPGNVQPLASLQRGSTQDRNDFPMADIFIRNFWTDC